MKLTKRQLKRIIKEAEVKLLRESAFDRRVTGVFSNGDGRSSHQQFLDRENEKRYRKSPEYYEKKMKEYSVDLLEIFIEQDEEEFEYYKDILGTDDVDMIVEIYEELIQKLRRIK